MRKILCRRTTALAGTVCALLLGMSGVANADDPIYSNAGPVNIRVGGGEVLALITCIADAQDGVINTAINQCHQIATDGNSIELQDVNVAVYPYTWMGPYLYRGSSVDVWISGASAAAIARCLADAQDGVINTAVVQCHQIPTAGNMLMLSGVGIYVYE